MPDHAPRRPRGRSVTPTPGSIGARVRHLRMRDRMTQDDLAAAVNTTKATISRYETNDFSPPDPVVERLADIFHVTKAYIRDGDESVRRAAIVGIVGAGAAVMPVDNDLDLGGIEVPASWQDAIALRISGDSMLPLYQDGGILIVRGEQHFDPATAVGKVCQVHLADGTSMVKEVRRGAALERYDLLSLNAAPIEGVRIVSARPVRAYYPPE